ncbi:hypothetical protein KAZ66_00740 [Candidatus Woesebacteria bacterium]|nr:hypothetical protein [Candidatus Woesebacteria bacterium]
MTAQQNNKVSGQEWPAPKFTVRQLVALHGPDETDVAILNGQSDGSVYGSLLSKEAKTKGEELQT